MTSHRLCANIMSQYVCKMNHKQGSNAKIF
nr:MAG TPA: hypothetical protein [Caudoviricetes sp.]